MDALLQALGLSSVEQRPSGSSGGPLHRRNHAAAAVAAVGIGCGTGCVSSGAGGIAGCRSGCARGPRSAGTASREEAAAPLVDVERVAAETDRGALELEVEASRLTSAPLAASLTLLTRWSQSLRQRPKPDDPSATFRAVFLRSDALSRMLTSLARNPPLQAALRDPPLFMTPAAAADQPEQALLAEARSLLQLSFRRSAGHLAAPVLEAALECDSGTGNGGFDDGFSAAASEALHDLVRVLKDDWLEAVRCQAVRALERRIDALAYELQKSSTVPRRGGGGAISARGPRPGPTTAVGPAHYGSGFPPGSSAAACSSSAPARRAARDRIVALARLCESLQEAQRRAEGRCSDLFAALRLFGVEPPSSKASSCGGGGSGSERDQSEASEACSGIDVGGATVLEEQQAQVPRTHRCCMSGGGIVTGGSSGKVADAVAKQHFDLTGERLTLLEQLRCVEQRFGDVNLRLERYKGFSRESTTTSSQVDGLSTQQQTPRSLPAGLKAALSESVEALAAECQRGFERLATQLQQRRAELLRGLAAHLEGEQDRICSMASAMSAAPATSAAHERFSSALQEVRDLCRRAEAVTCGFGQSSGSALDSLSIGQRCRAKWMDGNYYDATVHRILPDGVVIVNWLRPCPEGDDTSPNARQLVTVSENGGDDSLHRLVQQTDIQLDRVAGRAVLDTAMRIFENRRLEDLECVDCGRADADWASVSFGTFLCSACAEEHKQLGAQISYVRQLGNGWGWTDQDLQYLCRGGNAAFRTTLDRFPALSAAPISERYSSRFAEHYRRHLDSLCTGAQAPPPLLDPTAASLQTAATSDFLSAAEAAELARKLRPHLEAVVKEAGGTVGAAASRAVGWC
mmetsp:Transcript_111486/g.288226  ORF Transcript_111486/g.288226 Transcript_111486/m.288226 type:complete len:860 (+) Transcript_111486:64-2643(+)